MNSLKRCLYACAGLMLATCASRAWGQTLYDPSFELATNPLPFISEVLGPPSFVPGFWGAENALVVPNGDGIVPRTGTQMLQMWDDGLSVTQAFQAVDVSALAECIDAGGVSVTFLARFNAPGLPAEMPGVEVGFYGCDACWGQDLAPAIATDVEIDGSPSTWETLTVTGNIPVGTRWLAVQVHFRNSTLLGRAGYVDDAELTVDCPPTPVVPLSWGRVKDLYR